jgi:solute carrier family 23 (nucleobase transporter), member 1
MSAVSPSQVELNYGLEDVPKPFPKALGLGLQHVLTMFGATIAGAVHLGPAMGIDTVEIAILISSVFICSGVATRFQVLIGSPGSPSSRGCRSPSSAPSSPSRDLHPGEDAMRYIAGMVMVGALIEVTVGFGGLFGAPAALHDARSRSPRSSP